MPLLSPVRSPILRPAHGPFGAIALPAYAGVPIEFSFTMGGGSLPEGAILTRASVGWHFDAAGNLNQAAIDEARFDYSFGASPTLLGLLVEPERTNQVRNGQMSPVGAAAPTNYASQNITGCTYAFTVAASAKFIGNTMDVQIANANASGQAQCNVRVETNGNVIAVLPDRTYVGSWYTMTGADGPFVGVFPQLSWNTPANGFIRTDNGTQIDPPSEWTRIEKVQLSPSNAGFAHCRCGMSTLFGTTRSELWALPQFELVGPGEVQTATSPIVTTGAPVTRKADRLTLDLPDAVFDLDIETPQGIFTAADVAGGPNTVFQWPAEAIAAGARHVLRITARAPGGAAWFVDSAVPVSGNGTSWASAWKNLSDINWSAIQPGDTLYLSGGATSKTYTGQMNVNASGTKAKRIRITKGVDAGHNGTVILDGQGTAVPVININGDNYVTVEKLTVRNPLKESCISPWFCTGVIIQDCILETGNGSNNALDNVRGIHALSATDLIVRRNFITTGSNTLCQADGIYLQSCTNFLIEDNVVQIENVDTTGHSDAFQTHTVNSGTVRRNTFISAPAGADNHVAWMHAVNSGQTLDFYDNICWSRGGQFNVTYWRESDGSGHGAVNIFNNTIYGGPRCVNLERVANVVVKNNIIWPDAAGTAWVAAITDPPPANVTHNIVWAPSANIASTAALGGRTYAQWTATDGYNASGLNQDPLLTNPAAGDFTLQGSSPAINAGATLAVVAYDRDGVSRPQGAAYDIGAYEVAA